MLAYCGRPSSASFCDRFPYIGARYARETIAETCSMRVALATAIIGQTGSARKPAVSYFFLAAERLAARKEIPARIAFC
jgi:hypothetical protein